MLVGTADGSFQASRMRQNANEKAKGKTVNIRSTAYHIGYLVYCHASSYRKETHVVICFQTSLKLAFVILGYLRISIPGY